MPFFYNYENFVQTFSVVNIGFTANVIVFSAQFSAIEFSINLLFLSQTKLLITVINKKLAAFFCRYGKKDLILLHNEAMILFQMQTQTNYSKQP